MRIPQALDVAKAAADRLRRREVSPRELGRMLQATRSVEEYRANTNTKAALRRLRDSGTERRPGEYVKYVVAREDGPWEGRTVPVGLFDDEGSFGAGATYHLGHYLRLLAHSVETLLAPFGYTEDNVEAWLAGRQAMSRPPMSRRIDVPPRPAWVAVE